MILPSYYLAPISYYVRLAQCPSAVVDFDEIYRKQTLHNRCWIASPNGPMSLTVPVVKFVPYRTPMRDIRISDHGNWRHLHWNALRSNYGRTPFFEFYADDFAPFYERRWDFLVDYNQALQDMILKEELGIKSEELSKREAPSLTGSSLTGSSLTGSSLSAPSLPPYYQLFSDRHGFMSDLSIVDLLFNIGPEALLYLQPPKPPKALKALKAPKAPKAPF